MLMTLSLLRYCVPYSDDYSLPVAPLLSSSIYLLYGLLSFCISLKCPQTPLQYSFYSFKHYFCTYSYHIYKSISQTQTCITTHLQDIFTSLGLWYLTLSDPNEVIISKVYCSYSLFLSQWFISLSSLFFHYLKAGGSSLLPRSLLSPKHSYYKTQTTFLIHLMLSSLFFFFHSYHYHLFIELL